MGFMMIYWGVCFFETLWLYIPWLIYWEGHTRFQYQVSPLKTLRIYPFLLLNYFNYYKYGRLLCFRDMLWFLVRFIIKFKMFINQTINNQPLTLFKLKHPEAPSPPLHCPISIVAWYPTAAGLMGLGSAWFLNIIISKYS